MPQGFHRAAGAVRKVVEGQASVSVPPQLLRDGYDVIGDLMAGVGKLALSADQIARMNETCVVLERLGVRNVPDRLKRA